MQPTNRPGPIKILIEIWGRQATKEEQKTHQSTEDIYAIAGFTCKPEHDFIWDFRVVQVPSLAQSVCLREHKCKYWKAATRSLGWLCCPYPPKLGSVFSLITHSFVPYMIMTRCWQRGSSLWLLTRKPIVSWSSPPHDRKHIGHVMTPIMIVAVIKLVYIYGILFYVKLLILTLVFCLCVCVVRKNCSHLP